VFVRFAGCNLSCPWCDTDHSVKENLTVNELRTRISETIGPGAELIVLTGGEPTLYDLEPLIDWWAPLETAIETNGTRPDDLARYKRRKCPRLWITVSPKTGYTNWRGLKFADEIKVVYDQDAPLEEIAETYLRFLPRRLFIQPRSGDIRPALDYVMAHPWWRLSVQLHKLIGVRE
jgi:organic radical activating enzyme